MRDIGKMYNSCRSQYLRNPTIPILKVKKSRSCEADSIALSTLSNTKDENEPPPEGGEEKNPEAEKPRRTRIEIRKEERTKVKKALLILIGPNFTR